MPRIRIRPHPLWSAPILSSAQRIIASLHSQATEGRYSALSPAKLANNDPVFTVIAYNTNLVLIQEKVDYRIPIAFEDQKSGVGLRVKPVSFFIHESEENFKFSQMSASDRQSKFYQAHSYAMIREAHLRAALSITGGFAGGVIRNESTVPRR
jgi:hypothetical protein